MCCISNCKEDIYIYIYIYTYIYVYMYIYIYIYLFNRKALYIYIYIFNSFTYLSELNLSLGIFNDVTCNISNVGKKWLLHCDC